MKKLVHLIILLLSVYLLAAQWTQTGSIYGGTVNDLIFYRQNLYAATDNGIFFSTDTGKTWTPTIIDTYYKSVKHLTVKDSAIYASPANSGVFKSTDGKTFTRCWDDPNRNIVNTIEAIGGKLFIGTWGKGVWVSEDDGISWTAKNTGLPAVNNFVESFAVSGDIIYAGTMSGIYYSADSGESWTQLTNWFSLVTDLLVDSTDIYALSGSYVLVSHDSGNSWTRAMYEGQDFNTGFPFYPRKLGKRGDTLILYTDEGILKSTDKGINWTKTGAPANAFYSGLSINNSNTVLAGSKGEGIFISRDAGQSWSKCNEGLTAVTMLIPYINGNILLVPTAASGIYYSDNFGKSWEQVAGNMKYDGITSIIKKKDHYYASTIDGALYRSGADAKSWSIRSERFVRHMIRELCFAGDTMFVATGSGVFYSLDYGLSWVDFNEGLGPYPHAMSILYADNALWIGTQEKGIYRRELNKDKWEVVNTGIDEFTIHELNAIGNKVYASGFRGRLFSTVDKGANWIPMDEDVMPYVYDIHFYNDTIVATGFTDIAYSIDTGRTWKVIKWGVNWPTLNFIVFGEGYLFTSGAAGESPWRMDFPTPLKVEQEMSLMSSVNVYPNPVYGSGRISFSQKKIAYTSISIKDALGKTVITPLSGYTLEGDHSISFNTEQLEPGIYYYEVICKDEKQQGKIIVLKE